MCLRCASTVWGDRIRYSAMLPVRHSASYELGDPELGLGKRLQRVCCDHARPRPSNLGKGVPGGGGGLGRQILPRPGVLAQPEGRSDHRFGAVRCPDSRCVSFRGNNQRAPVCGIWTGSRQRGWPSSRHSGSGCRRGVRGDQGSLRDQYGGRLLAHRAGNGGQLCRRRRVNRLVAAISWPSTASRCSSGIAWHWRRSSRCCSVQGC
jgi:hypothetical protein